MWIVAYFTESPIMGDIAALVGSGILLRWFWSIFGNGFEMIRLLRLGAIILAFLQNTAWLSATYIHRFSLHKSIESTLFVQLGGGMRLDSYFKAIIFITIFTVLISFFGSVNKIKFYESYFYQNLMKLNDVSLNYIVYPVVFLSAVNFLLIASGVVGQRNISVEGYDAGELPFWYVLFKSLLPVVALLNALLLIKIRKNNLSVWFWVVLIVSSILFIYINFTQGRRPFIFGLVSFGYWYCFFLSLKPKLKSLIIIAVIVYPMVSQLLVFSNFLRGENANADWQNESAVDFLPAAWESFTSSSQVLEEEEESTTSNLASRPLVATPLALSMQLPLGFQGFTMGENMINSLVWAIPGPIFPNKADYPTQETLLYQHFKIAGGMDLDTADSLYLVAYTEFSWAGIVIYAFFLYLFWYSTAWLIYNFGLSGIYSAISVAMFFELLVGNIGESTPTAFFIVLRSFIFWIVIYKALLFFKIIKNKPVNSVVTV